MALSATCLLITPPACHLQLALSAKWQEGRTSAGEGAEGLTRYVGLFDCICVDPHPSGPAALLKDSRLVPLPY